MSIDENAFDKALKYAGNDNYGHYRAFLREYLDIVESAKAEQPDGLLKVIYKALNGHKMIHQKIRDTDMALPLVDYLTPEGWITINGGMEENEAIAETIVDAISRYLMREISQP